MPILIQPQELSSFASDPEKDNNQSDSSSSSSLSSDSSETHKNELIYPVLNSRGLKAQTIAVWCYLKPNSIAIFPPGETDLMSRIVKYSENYLGYERNQHKLTMLTPGQLSPLDIKSAYSVRPGSVVMIFPRTKNQVTIEISQLTVSFSLSVDISMSVYSLKKRVKKKQGIPIDRQELLFMEQALENNRRLLEYKVKNRSTLHLMIQAHFDLLLNVDTFWGISYRFYVDPCSTGTDVVKNVFRRTFSPKGPKEYNNIHEFIIPLHTLILSHRSRFVQWEPCLAGMGIKSGDTLLLTTVVHQNDRKSQNISVITESGQKYEVKASRYDRWSVVAFLLHGLTYIPVDFIKLYKDNQSLDLLRPIGEVAKGTSIVMNNVMTHVDGDLMFGVPLRVSLGNGIIENVKIAANKPVRRIKKRLEHWGVPNALQYQLLTDENKNLPNSSIIQNVVYDLKTTLSLKLEDFPVFVHTPDGVIYKTYTSVMQSIGHFKQKMQIKSGFNMDRCRLIIAGEELHEQDSAILYDAGVSLRTSIFVKLDSKFELFNVLGSSSVSSISIPFKPTASDIERTLKNNKNIPEGSYNCLLTFMYWFFVHRIVDKNKVSYQKQIKKRLPKAKDKLFPFTFTGNLQDNYPHGTQTLPPNYFPGISSPKAFPKAHHHIKSKKSPSFEPTQFLDAATAQGLQPSSSDSVAYGWHRSHMVPFPDIHHLPNKSQALSIAKVQDYLEGSNQFDPDRKQFTYLNSDDDV